MQKKVIVLWILSMLLLFLLARDSVAEDKPDKNRQFDFSFSFEDLSALPVKILKAEKQKDDSILLTTQFPSPFITKQDQFIIEPDLDRDTFFKASKDNWQEEVTRAQFLKIAKKDYWFIWYKPGNPDTLCKAAQFKNWEQLRASFAQDADNVEGSVDSPDFWTSLRTKQVSFYHSDFAKDKVYWVEIVGDTALLPEDEMKDIEKMDKIIDEFMKKGEYNPLISMVAGLMGTTIERVRYLLKISRIELEEGKHMSKRMKLKDGSPGVIKSYGSFLVHPKCVFNTVETKEIKSLLNLPVIGSVRTWLRPIMFGRNYFEKNILKTPWICVYNVRTNTLLRAATANMLPEEPMAQKDDKKK